MDVYWIIVAVGFSLFSGWIVLGLAGLVREYFPHLKRAIAGMIIDRRNAAALRRTRRALDWRKTFRSW